MFHLYFCCYQFIRNDSQFLPYTIIFSQAVYMDLDKAYKHFFEHAEAGKILTKAGVHHQPHWATKMYKPMPPMEYPANPIVSKAVRPFIVNGQQRYSSAGHHGCGWSTGSGKDTDPNRIPSECAQMRIMYLMAELVDAAILDFLARNKGHVILIDSRNFTGGNMKSKKLLNNALAQLPISYKQRPVVYVVIRYDDKMRATEYKENKIFISTNCVVFTKKGPRSCTEFYYGDPAKQLAIKAETDDMVLIMIYRMIHAKFPKAVHILSGDKYSWCTSDITNYLKLRRNKVTGYQLMISHRHHANRGTAYELPRGQEAKGVIGSVPACARASASGISGSKLKTMMCGHYLAGSCSKGKACKFAHSLSELPEHIRKTYKTTMCASVAGKQRCKRGLACSYAHSKAELRKYHP